jgi:hypothetical protein
MSLGRRIRQFFHGGDLEGSSPNPTVKQARGLRETSGPTTLVLGAIADGEFLKRSGATVVGGAPGASGTPFEMEVACSGETTPLVTATGVTTFRMPRAVTLTEVRASLKTPAGSGTFTVDINEGGSTILSTKITIDATEKTSVTAATPPVISDSSLADDAEMTVDIDDDASGDAVGLKITLVGTRT